MKPNQGSRKFWKISAFAMGLLVSGATLAGAQQDSGAIQKKFIEAGWDKPDTATLRKNLAQMEKTPFDGVIIGVTGNDDTGKLVRVQATMSNVPWKKEWFQSSIDDLKAIHSQKLTDNFIIVGDNPGNVDWFDDAGWKQVVDHWRIAAWIAREGHLKGILFDAEPYTKPYAQMNYSVQPERGKHSLEEYQAKARQRGKEIISAVASVDPNLIINTFFMNSVNAMAANTPNPRIALQSSNYNLYPAFINGWLDAAPPSMIFVDGCESQGYRANSQLDFLQTANLIRNGALNLVAPEDRQKYLAQVQVSFGLYLDAYVNPPTSLWYVDPKGSTPTHRLQINAASAVNAANEYVWIYGEKYRWWPTSVGSVNPQGWDDVLPGVSDALLAVTHPDQMVAQKIAELKQDGKLVDLLQNGNFSATKPNTTVTNNAPAPLDWKSVGAPPGWSTWQTDDSHGTFSQDNSVNHGGDQSGAARLAGVSNGCLIQSINVKPGDSYIVQSNVRQNGQGTCWVRVRWQTADNKWMDEASDVLLFGADTSDKSAWRKIEGMATVPDDAGKMVILLSVANQSSPQDVAWFDDVHAYNIK